MLLAGSCACAPPSIVVAELQRNGRASKRFGKKGVVRVAVPGAEASSVVLAADGRIVVGGEAAGGWLLAGLTPAGRLDRAFARDGVSVAPGLGGVEALTAGADGAITAVGSAVGPADTDFEVRRYLP
jgi:hypothetical protein